MCVYQSQSSEHWQAAVNQLEGEVQDAGRHDDQVKDVPTTVEVFLAECQQLQETFQREDGCEHLKRDVIVVQLRELEELRRYAFTWKK